MKVLIKSKKFGEVYFEIDKEDYLALRGWSYYAWSTAKHHGIYINCYSPENRSIPLRLHRVILGAKTGEIVDHIDGNPLNNSRANLRVVSYSGNNCNARKRTDGTTSKYKGVSKTAEGTWKAQIQSNYKKIALGCYKTEIEAAEAYSKASLVLHGQYARKI